MYKQHDTIAGKNCIAYIFFETSVSFISYKFTSNLLFKLKWKNKIQTCNGQFTKFLKREEEEKNEERSVQHSVVVIINYFYNLKTVISDLTCLLK